MPEDYKSIISTFLEEREIFFYGSIKPDSATKIITQLLYLERTSPREEITLYINSHGGEIAQGLGIYDTMQAITSPVKTVGIGQVKSMASAILAGGEPGRRYALPNTTIMLHQPHQQIGGNQNYVQSYAENLKRYRLKLEEIIASHSGQDPEKVHKDFEKEYFLTVEEAKDYGLIDEILTDFGLAPK